MSRLEQTDTKTKLRVSEFKKSVDADDLRKNRKSLLSSIRKQKTQSRLRNKRSKSLGINVQKKSASNEDNGSLSGEALYEREARDNFENEDFVEMMLKFLFDDEIEENQIQALIFFRRTACTEENAPKDKIVSLANDTFLERVYELLKKDNLPVQIEAAWLFTNIASGNSEHVRRVVVCGGEDEFDEETGKLTNMSTPTLLIHYASDMERDEAIRDQCIFCLGNIAGDSDPFRTYCLERGLVDAILAQFNDDSGEELLNNSVWAASNICRQLSEQIDGSGNSIRLPFDEARVFVEPLSAVVINTEDVNMLMYALQGISHIIESEPEPGEESIRIDAIIESGCLYKIGMYLACQETNICYSALLILGNIVSASNPKYTEFVCQMGLFREFTTLLSNESSQIRKETVWLISNIAAGTKEQVQMIIDNNIILQIITQMLISDRYAIKKEACWAISNALCKCDESQVWAIVNRDVINGLGRMLITGKSDPQVLNVTLQGLDKILSVAEKCPDGGHRLRKYKHLYNEEHVVDNIMELETHEFDSISTTCFRIINTYFDEEIGEEEEEEEEEEENETLVSIQNAILKTVSGTATTSSSLNNFSNGFKFNSQSR